MANQLRMDKVYAILTLHEAGWSDRQIARKLGVHRETVARHVRLAKAGSKPATNAPPGSDAGTCPLGRPVCIDRPGSPGPQAAELPPGCPNSAACPWSRACSVGDSKAAGNAPIGSPGVASACEPYREVILAKLRQGLTAQRIYQDLVTDRSFEGSYYSVRRFVRKLGRQEELPFRRMECPPGQEAQVDFGAGAPILDGSGRRRSHVFRVVLSHSRKGYSESVFRQRTDDFLTCLENAFWDFGGVPRTIVIDNLKAAVKRPDWYDPQLNPRILAFCEHYGTVILPTKPYMPRHKGKVERGIDYVQNNALKGHRFGSLRQQNRHLEHWESTVADTRIHGTTRQQVGKVFQEVEKAALLRLPAGRFPFFHEARRTVHRDGHVEVDKAYYSIPPEYLGRRVWVRWDGRMVRVFNRRMEQIAVHAQRQPGQFSTQDRHIVSKKISAVERGTGWLMRRVSLIGRHAERWAAAMLAARGIPGIRVLHGLTHLANRYDSDRIERACRIALTHRAFHLRAIRELIQRGGGEQESFEYLAEHEIIRDLSSYGHIVRAAIQQQPAIPQPLCAGKECHE
jgi:transposase